MFSPSLASQFTGKHFFSVRKSCRLDIHPAAALKSQQHSAFNSSCSHTFYQLILENDEHDDHWQKSQCQNSHDHRCIHRVLPLAIWEFQGQYSMNTPMIMAVLTLTLLPMIIMFIIFQDKLVKGMTAGAVKG